MKLQSEYWGVIFVPENKHDKDILAELYTVLEIDKDNTYEGGEIVLKEGKLELAR
ncbi:MAG: hypothetical protein GY707_05365 [Desulfobacteraceae bacterium]|nr:hypothetical protein [Desulfobacteraceae bacterium]